MTMAFHALPTASLQGRHAPFPRSVGPYSCAVAVGYPPRQPIGLGLVVFTRQKSPSPLLDGSRSDHPSSSGPSAACCFQTGTIAHAYAQAHPSTGLGGTWHPTVMHQTWDSAPAQTLIPSPHLFPIVIALSCAHLRATPIPVATIDRIAIYYLCSPLSSSSQFPGVKFNGQAVGTVDLLRPIYLPTYLGGQPSLHHIHQCTF